MSHFTTNPNYFNISKTLKTKGCADPTGLAPERVNCGCPSSRDVFRLGGSRNCNLRNVQLRVAPDCNTVDVLAVEKGVQVFQLEGFTPPPESVVVNNVPPVAGVPRVFPNRGNFASSSNYTPL